jgi:gliding motility-associated-like protein
MMKKILNFCTAYPGSGRIMKVQRAFIMLVLLVCSSQVFSQSVVTTINYTGFLGCGGCKVCGTDYWCMADYSDGFPSPCNNTSNVLSKTFVDPVPAGNLVTSITFQYYTADCSSGTLSATVDGNTVPTITDGNSGCLCSTNPCGVTASVTNNYPCGMPGYVYGGTNTLTLTDGGAAVCISHIVLTISYVAPVVINPVITPSGPTTFCAGGSVTLDAGAGYTAYHWSTGATSRTITVTTGGTYTVTVTSSTGCTSGNASITITVNPSPTVTASASPASICGGGSTTLTGGGATTYTWNPGALSGASVVVSPASTTTYTVTGTSAGCTGTQQVVVTVNPTPVVSASASPLTICSGTSTTLTGSGATTYTWNPGSLSGSSVVVSPGSTTTYTLVGTTSGCPSAPQTVTINVNPTPTITASASPATICPSTSSTLTAGGASTYTWSPATGLSATTGSSVVSTPPGTITYTVTGTAANGCTSTQTVTVTVSGGLTVSVTPPSSSFCVGGSTTLTASGATSYTWSPGTGLSATNTAAVTANPGTTETYTVTGTTGGCSGTQTVTVTVNPLPTISVAPPSSTFCAGGSVSLTASGATSYTWSPGTGLSATNTASVTANPGTSQTYTVTGTDVNGCTNTQTVVVNVNPLPTVTVTPPSPGICPGGNVILTSGGATTYTWSPATGLSGTTGSSVTANPGSTQTYVVTGTDVNGCTNTASVTVNVGVIAVTASATSSTLCNGTTATITASGATSYTWSPGTGLSSTTGAVVTANPSSTTTYTLVGTAGTGCTDTVNITITVDPLPSVTLTSGTPNICSGDTAILNAGGATTYTWSPGTGLNSTTGATVDAGPGSNMTYTVTGTDGNGCTNTSTVTINVSNIVVVPTATNLSICAGSSTTLSATGATNYVWSPATGLSATTGTPVIANPTGTTLYSVVGTTTGHCKDSVTINITVNPLPTVTVSASTTSMCNGNTSILTASGASTYTWTPATGLSSTTGSSVSANPATTVTYTVTGTDVNGCDSTASITITVNPSPTLSIAALAGGDTICSGQSVVLNASGATTYNWGPATGLSCNNCANPTATVTGPITYTVTGSNGVCIDSATISLFVPTPIAPVMTASNDSICAGKTIQISLTAGGGKPGYTYSWNNGLGTGAGPFNVAPGSSTNYVCTVTDACNDSIKDSIMVFVSPSPVASFTPIPDTILGGQYVSFVNKSTGATSWVWTMGNGNTVTDSFPYQQYTVPGDYLVHLTVSNSFGCTDSVSETVYVIENLVVPNVFTPNGDGKNDVFHVTAGGMKTYAIEIFNRWGEKVFTADSPEIDWTGNSQAGLSEPDGAYYYQINAVDYKGKQYSLDGYIQLIRN